MPAASHIDIGSAATLRSIGALLLSQVVFLTNDACVKLVNQALPLGETLALRNAVAVLCIAAFGMIYGGLSWPAHVPAKLFSLRLVGEVLSTFLGFWALSRMAIADVAALGQFVPIGMMAAGALFLGEPVGWRRWLAAAVGLCGVMLIIQPGTSAFNWAAIVVLAALGLGIMRDLATRLIGPVLSTLMLTFTSAAAVLVSALALTPFEPWHTPGLREVMLSVLSGFLLSVGYVLLITSLRTGDLATVTPFRYFGVLTAILIGYIVWGELPNALSVSGVTIVIAAGLYTLHRERRRKHGLVMELGDQRAYGRPNLLESERL
jgi:drug/metabolite transporter (DMT)-like permease